MYVKFKDAKIKEITLIGYNDLTDGTGGSYNKWILRNVNVNDLIA